MRGFIMFAQQETIHPSIISPAHEIGSYEALWMRHPSVNRVADIFKRFNHALPSVVAHEEGVQLEEIEQTKSKVNSLMPLRSFSALFYDDFEYPRRLKDANYPVEVLYYRGILDLLSSRSVSVVGSRKASEEGIKRARKVAKILVENGLTVISGLAKGIDTAAHQTAIEMGGKTIAVIGTPLNTVYPKPNQQLQDEIAQNHLLVSQVPFYRYSLHSFQSNRFFFPERNKTMSALSEATVIVEASETSGSLIQAKAALEQGRKLFILKSCFEKGLDWPEKFLAQGAIKLNDGSELIQYLNDHGPTKVAKN
jgi:DNA processing protein